MGVRVSFSGDNEEDDGIFATLEGEGAGVDDAFDAGDDGAPSWRRNRDRGRRKRRSRGGDEDAREICGRWQGARTNDAEGGDDSIPPDRIPPQPRSTRNDDADDDDVNDDRPLTHNVLERPSRAEHRLVLRRHAPEPAAIDDDALRRPLVLHSVRRHGVRSFRLSGI
jgi:hypothetical protein